MYPFQFNCITRALSIILRKFDGMLFCVITTEFAVTAICFLRGLVSFRLDTQTHVARAIVLRCTILTIDRVPPPARRGAPPPNEVAAWLRADAPCYLPQLESDGHEVMPPCALHFNVTADHRALLKVGRSADPTLHVRSEEEGAAAPPSAAEEGARERGRRPARQPPLATSISSQTATAASSSSGALQSTSVTNASAGAPLVSATVSSVETVATTSYPQLPRTRRPSRREEPSASTSTVVDSTTFASNGGILVMEASAVSNMRVPMIASALTVVVAALLQA